MDLNPQMQENIARRYQICQDLIHSFGVEKDPAASCSDLPCFVACPLQEFAENCNIERRRCKRREMQVPIVYGSRLELRALTQDISMGGLKIRSGSTLPAGQRVLVRFSEQRDCVAEAVVVWRNGVNMGLRFTKMSGSFKLHVCRLLSVGRKADMN